MQAQSKSRQRGTGSLSARRDKTGAETWYGRFWVGGRLVKRRLGPKRRPGEKSGLTKSQAERELRKLMHDTTAAPLDAGEKPSFAEAGRRYLAHLEAGPPKKRSTREAYESYLRVHLAPFFAGRSVESIDTEAVEAFIRLKRSEGKAPKSIDNWIGLLHSIFTYAERKGWCVANPVKGVDKLAAPDADPDIRFLDQAEVEALRRARRFTLVAVLLHHPHFHHLRATMARVPLRRDRVALGLCVLFGLPGR